MFRPFRRRTCLPGYPSPTPDDGVAPVVWHHQLVLAGLLAAGALLLMIEVSAAEAALLVTAVAAGAAQLSRARQR